MVWRGLFLVTAIAVFRAVVIEGDKLPVVNDVTVDTLAWEMV
jgi:hypothetical protein